jgi:hypothetical protein
MKTNSVRFLISTSLVAASLSFAPFAKAGPGVDYWRRAADARVAQPSAAVQEKSSAACTDSRVVQVTNTHNAWANGRGPMVTSTETSKLVCNSCGGTEVVTKRTWLNGKGPSVTKVVPSLHDCTSCGTAAKS